MVKKQSNLKLDIAVENDHQYIGAKQLDNKSRFVSIEITDKGNKLVPDAGTTAIFRALKPDGKSVNYPATIKEDGTILVELSQQALAVRGVVKADISLVGSDGSVLSTASFFIQVQEAPIGIDAQSETQILVFQELTAQALKAVSDSSKNLKLCVDASDTALNAKDAAVQSAKDASSAKDTAVSAKVATERISQDYAESIKIAIASANNAEKIAQKLQNDANTGKFNGKGISSITGNADGSWTITYTDGTSETISNEAYNALKAELNKKADKSDIPTPDVWEDLVNETLTEPKGFFEYNFNKKYKKLHIEIVGCGVRGQSFPQDMAVTLDTLDVSQPVLFCESPNKGGDYTTSVFSNKWKRCILDINPHQYGLKADFHVGQWNSAKEEVDYYSNIPDGQTSHGFVKKTFVNHIIMLANDDEASAFVVGSTIKIKGVAL